MASGAVTRVETSAIEIMAADDPIATLQTVDLLAIAGFALDSIARMANAPRNRLPDKPLRAITEFGSPIESARVASLTTAWNRLSAAVPRNPAPRSRRFFSLLIEYRPSRAMLAKNARADEMISAPTCAGALPVRVTDCDTKKSRAIESAAAVITNQADFEDPG